MKYRKGHRPQSGRLKNTDGNVVESNGEKGNSSTLQLLEKTFAFHQMVCHYVARIGCKLPFSHQELEVSKRLGDKNQNKN